MLAGLLIGLLLGLLAGVALGILWSRHAIKDLAENDQDWL